MIRYGIRLGCRWGQPHDFATLGETPKIKYERCRLCRVSRSYKKGYKGRIDNVQYLRDHVRQFAQEGGATRRVFARLYKPEKCLIKIS